MLKFKNNKFEVQNIHKCKNYNWSKDKNTHCAMLFSESLEKPVNAYIKYSKCLLDDNCFCTNYNCGVQLIGG